MKTNLRILTAAATLLGVAVTFPLTGCAGTRLSRSTGEFIDDAAVTTRVKTAFINDPVVSALHVDVDTFRGNVQLNGFVNGPTEKARAEQIARNVAGVASVKNNLVIKTDVNR